MATSTASAPSTAPAVAVLDDTHTPDAINDAISALQDLANVQLKLQKERSSIERLELVHRMLDGELLTEDELTSVKQSLKGLGKYAGLYASYQAALENAQQARDLIDQIIGYSTSNTPTPQEQQPVGKVPPQNGTK
ncbi:MAG: hypothetical protein WBA10_01580 [Elainellaceae cyanobacterium]